MKPTLRTTLTVAVLLFLGLAAITSGIMRMGMLGDSMSTGQLPTEIIDLRYALHPYLSALHVIPGIIFVLSGPLQFIPLIRRKAPWLHRWFGRIFIVSGVIAAVSSILMCLIFPAYGGIWTTLASLTFGSAMMFTLFKGYRAIMHRDISRHRAWMIRSFAIGLSVSTIRLFFVLQDILLGSDLDASFASSFWTGFIVNMLVAEVILFLTSRRSNSAVA